MLTKLMVAALIGSALVAVPALAQSPAPSTAPAVATQASNGNDWRASKLIGLNVYNSQDEKIGDIKELMTDKSGKLDLAVVGAGGFLGIGSHDVAIKFSELKFVDEAPKPAVASTPGPVTGTTTGAGPATTTMAPATPKNYPDHAVLNMTKDQLKAAPAFDYTK